VVLARVSVALTISQLDRAGAGSRPVTPRSVDIEVSAWAERVAQQDFRERPVPGHCVASRCAGVGEHPSTIRRARPACSSCPRPRSRDHRLGRGHELCALVHSTTSFSPGSLMRLVNPSTAPTGRGPPWPVQQPNAPTVCPVSSRPRPAREPVTPREREDGRGPERPTLDSVSGWFSRAEGSGRGDRRRHPVRPRRPSRVCPSSSSDMAATATTASVAATRNVGPLTAPPRTLRRLDRMRM